MAERGRAGSRAAQPRLVVRVNAWEIWRPAILRPGR